MFVFNHIYLSGRHEGMLLLRFFVVQKLIDGELNWTEPSGGELNQGSPYQQHQYNHFNYSPNPPVNLPVLISHLMHEEYF